MVGDGQHLRRRVRHRPGVVRRDAGFVARGKIVAHELEMRPDGAEITRVGRFDHRDGRALPAGHEAQFDVRAQPGLRPIGKLEA